MLRHDGTIVLAAIRNIAVRRSDLMILVPGLPLLLLIVHAWARDLNGHQRLILVAGASCACTFAAVIIISNRLHYHRSEGILAPFALRFGPASHFALTLYGIAVASGYAGLMMLGAMDWALWAIGTMAGTIAAALWQIGLRMSEQSNVRWSGWEARMSRPAVSWVVLSIIGAGAGAACLFLPIGLPGRTVFTVLACLAASMMLGQVQAETVSFMTMVGHSSAAVIRGHLPRIIGFLASFTLVLVIAREWTCAAMAGAFLVAMPMLMVLRILAYRSFGRRMADWMVVVVIALAAMAGMMLPLLVPVVLLSGLWWLARRAAEQTWLIA
jgi:hypothetical protein